MSDHRAMQLNPRQRAFVAEYLKDRNATQSAIRAGYSARSARQMASDLLTVPAIALEIAAAERQVREGAEAQAGLTLAATLKALQRGVEFDVRRLFDSDGSPRPIAALDPDTAACIEGIEVEVQFEGRGEERRPVGRVLRYKLARRLGYVDLAMRHFGAFAKDNEQAGKAAAGAISELVAQMRGSALGVVKQAPGDA